MRRADSTKEAEGLFAGLDEVGMGCWAGPLCVAVVAFPTSANAIEGVKDSKKLSFNVRLDLAPVIMRRASFVGIGFSHPRVIDKLGLSEAWRRACLQALSGAPSFECLNIDGTRAVRGYEGEQVTHVKGDARIWQIGAASIVAKVVRDIDMMEMSLHYPHYCWETNMGYGSEAHQHGLEQHGPTHYHRWKYLRNLYGRLSSKGAINGHWKKWEAKWMNRPRWNVRADPS